VNILLLARPRGLRHERAFCHRLLRVNRGDLDWRGTVHSHLSAAFGLYGAANGKYWVYCDRPHRHYRHGGDAGHCLPPCQTARRCHMCEAVNVVGRGGGLHGFRRVGA
jgi:hypothetical protein